MLYEIFMLVVGTAAAVLATVLLLRFWIQAIRIRPPSSIAHFLFGLSDWLVKPLRRLVPGTAGYDWASMVGAFLVALALTLLTRLRPEIPFNIGIILLESLMHLVHWMLYGFMGLIIIDVILSWVNPHAPMAPLVRSMTDPLMRPLRRLIPLVGGIDLSPLVAFVLLRIALYTFDALIFQLT